MPRLRIHLVRHGEVLNPEGILYGRMPGYGLSARGFEMAQRIADALPEKDPHLRALIASPLQRAQETIAPLSERLSLPVATDERVIEAENEFEGTREIGRASCRERVKISVVGGRLQEKHVVEIY